MAGSPSAAAAAGSRGCSALAIGFWVGGFDVLYACQDLEFDRAHGLRSIPVRFGVPRVADDFAGDARRRGGRACWRWRGSTPLPAFYFAGVAVVALLLVYEQSLVSADDLSQVKRAFDLNGYVGILYLVVLAVVHLCPLTQPHVGRAIAITGASGAHLRGAHAGGAAARGVHVELVVSDYGRRLLRDELGDEARSIG